MDGRFAAVAELAPQLCSEDQAALGQLDDIPAISAWALARVEDYRKQIAKIETTIRTLHSVHNATVPIRRLPTELFMHTFSDPSLARHIVGVQQVCRYWREVCIGIPQIWVNALTNLRIGHRAWCFTGPIVESWISRTGALPLKLFIAHDLVNVWRSIAPITHRIADLVIARVESKDRPALEALLHSRWEQLVHLNLGNAERVFRDLQVSRHYRNFPRVRDLSLLGPSLPSAFTSYALKSLEIGGMADSFGTLLNTVKDCPTLEVLSLRDVWPPWVHALDDANFCVIHLPRLKKFYMEAINIEHTTQLLTCITFPQSTHVSLRFDLNARNPPVRPIHWPSMAFRSPADIDRLQFSYESTTKNMSLRAYAGNWEKLRIDVHIEGRHPVQIVDDASSKQIWHAILTAFETFPITTFSMHLTYLDSYAQKWFREMFTGFPRVKRLELLHTEIHQRLIIVEQFLQVQETRQPSVGDLTLAWTIPDRAQSGDRTRELEKLAMLLRQRESKHMAPLRTLELRHPAYRLEDIAITDSPLFMKGQFLGEEAENYEQSVVVELQGLVGDVVDLAKPSVRYA